MKMKTESRKITQDSCLSMTVTTEKHSPGTACLSKFRDTTVPRVLALRC